MLNDRSLIDQKVFSHGHEFLTKYYTVSGRKKNNLCNLYIVTERFTSDLSSSRKKSLTEFMAFWLEINSTNSTLDANSS